MVKPASRLPRKSNRRSLCTISLGVTNLAIGLSRQPQFKLEMLLFGISEVFAAAAISFAFLAVAWVCVAIGMRRRGLT